MAVRRALGVIRLSVGGLNQTGEETQKKKIETRCVAEEFELIDFAVDIDVSASLSPWDRPSLGKWLNENADSFDVLVVYRLDRIVRSSQDLNNLLSWLEANGKSMLSIEESFDLSTPWGKMVARLLAVLAEAELDSIKMRIRASRETLRAKGAWFGGVVPFGRCAVPVEDGKGYTLVLDPDWAPWLYRIIEKFKETRSFTATAAFLNAEKVPTAFDIARLKAKKANSSNTRLSGDKLKTRDCKWTQTQVQSLLSSRNLLGEYVRADKSIVRNPDGTPVMRSVPVLTVEQFDELQELIQTCKFVKGPQRSSPYLGVLVCGCKRPLYYTLPRNGRVDRFRCQGVTKDNIKPCPNSNFKASVIREEIKRKFLQVLGEKPIMEKHVTTDDASAMQMAVLDARLDQLTAELKGGNITATEYSSMMAATAVEREGISKAPVKSVVQWRAAGETFQTWWDRSTEQERRERLVTWGVKVTYTAESMTLDLGTQIYEGLKLGGEAFEEPVILSHRTEYGVMA